MNNTTGNQRRAGAAGAAAGSSGERENRIPLLPVIAVLVLLSLLSWTASYFCAVTEADVTVPDWAVNLLNYAAEILAAVRVAAMLASVACFLYGRQGTGRTVAVPAAVIPADKLIGIGSTWLSQGYGVIDPIGILWEIVLTAAAFLIASAVRNSFRKARNERTRAKRTRTRASVYCALPAALLPVFFGLYDLIVHLGQRRAYSSEDYQAGIVYFVGVLIREILVYVFIGAAAAYLTSKAFGRFPVFRKKGGIGPRSGKDSGTT